MIRPLTVVWISLEKEEEVEGGRGRSLDNRLIPEICTITVYCYGTLGGHTSQSIFRMTLGIQEQASSIIYKNIILFTLDISPILPLSTNFAINFSDDPRDTGKSKQHYIQKHYLVYTKHLTYPSPINKTPKPYLPLIHHVFLPQHHPQIQSPHTQPQLF